jgi:hypothetical protein
MGHSNLVSLKALAQAVIERGATPQNGGKLLPPPDSPAYSIIQTCQRYGVQLRLDLATGELVVGNDSAKVGEPTQPWPTILMASEAHLDEIAALVRAGWTLKADMPREHAA